MTIPKVVYGRRSKEYRIIDDDGVIVGSFPPGQKHQEKKCAIALANIRLDGHPAERAAKKTAVFREAGIFSGGVGIRGQSHALRKVIRFISPTLTALATCTA